MARNRKVKASKGANKALSAMKKRYGSARGKAIFFAKAEKFGKRGQTPSQKGNSVFSKGAHRVRRKK